LSQSGVGKIPITCDVIADPRRSRWILTLRLQLDLGDDEVFQWRQILVDFPAVTALSYIMADFLEDLLSAKLEKRFSIIQRDGIFELLPGDTPIATLDGYISFGVTNAHSNHRVLRYGEISLGDSRRTGNARAPGIVRDTEPELDFKRHGYETPAVTAASILLASGLSRSGIK
jgi:hypothetical protein